MQPAGSASRTSAVVVARPATCCLNTIAKFWDGSGYPLLAFLTLSSFLKPQHHENGTLCSSLGVENTVLDEV